MEAYAKPSTAQGGLALGNEKAPESRPFALRGCHKEEAGGIQKAVK